MNNNFDYYPQDDKSTFEQIPLAPMLSQNNGHAKGYSLAAMWLGIASAFCTMCCCCFYLVAPILSVIAIVMACLARRDNGKRMPGAAIAGLILAIIGLIAFAVILALEIYFLSLPDSELQQLIRDSVENNFGMSFEEYIDAVRNGM